MELEWTHQSITASAEQPRRSFGAYSTPITAVVLDTL